MSILQELEAAMIALDGAPASVEVACYVSDTSIEDCLFGIDDCTFKPFMVSEYREGRGYGNWEGEYWKYAIPVHMFNKIMLRTVDLALDYCDVPNHKLVNQWQRDAIEIIDLIEGD